ncbi:MAG: aminotransferase class IV [Spirochaetaceae bacterium]|jgi:D-alanine transaminase|nr:aminotransferase class IV [Spirochaetaceae bacterium]
METLGYYNGTIGLLDEMRVPMNDRVCWFGDGVYDATVSVNYRIFALEEHLHRFFNSATLLEMNVGITKAAVAELLQDLVRKVDSPTQFVYWQLTRGTALRTHAFPEQGQANLWVMIKPLVLQDIYQKIRLITVEDTRFLHCNIKTLNLLPNVLASEKAKQAGCAEAIFHRGNRVTEGSHTNVHIFKAGTLHTAPLDNLILPGVARAHIIAQCGNLGIPVLERPFTREELFSADEVMISSASTFCMSASHIDGRPVGGKAPALLRRLQEALLDEFHQYIGAPEGRS